MPIYTLGLKCCLLFLVDSLVWRKKFKNRAVINLFI